MWQLEVYRLVCQEKRVDSLSKGFVLRRVVSPVGERAVPHALILGLRDDTSVSLSYTHIMRNPGMVD